MIDGEVTSYFEWIGAGSYRVDERSGSMHGKKVSGEGSAISAATARTFICALDFHPGCEQELAGVEARLTVQTLDGAQGHGAR